MLLEGNICFFACTSLLTYVELFTVSCNRGSLFRLLHRPGMRELLDERRRVRMALDVVCFVCIFGKC